MQWARLFAQDTPVLPQTPTGWFGWGAALLSGGVVVWLLYRHIPDLLNQIKSLEARLIAKDEKLIEMIAQFNATLDKNRDEVEACRLETRESRHEFKNALQQILVHCEKETQKMVQAWREELDIKRRPRT